MEEIEKEVLEEQNRYINWLIQDITYNKPFTQLYNKKRTILIYVSLIYIEYSYFNCFLLFNNKYWISLSDNSCFTSIIPIFIEDF